MTSSASIQPATVTIWTDAERAGRDGAIIDRMGSAVRVVAVGGPRAPEVAALSRRVDCPHDDDGRKLMADHTVDFLLLGAVGDLTPQDIASAIAQGSIVLALEPVAAQLGDLAQIKPPRVTPPGITPGRVVPAPMFAESRGWRGAAHPFEVIGAVETVRLTNLGPPQDCSLLARMMDAWRSILPLCPMPLRIDASLTGQGRSSSEDPRQVTGHLAAHARLPNGGSLLVMISDRAGRHTRSAQMLGPHGQVMVHDLGYQLWDAGGNLLDESPPAGDSIEFIDIVAQQWLDLLRQTSGGLPPTTVPDEQVAREALACCLATLLSTRTGEPESPAKLAEIG